MKKRILSMLLACLILLSALPLGGYAAQASPRYTVSASQDQTTDVGKTVSMTVSVAGGSYNAYDLALTYDTARLTYVSGRTADRDASVAEKGGSIRVIGYGADKAVSTAVVTLTFKTKATGTAEVKISSAKIDSSKNAQTRNAPLAVIKNSTTRFIIQPRYTVTLEDGLTADSLSAAAGEDYTFRATDPLHYDYKPSAKVGGKDVTVKDNGDGTYTIPGSEINGNITVKANRNPKTYKVTFKGEDLSGEKLRGALFGQQHELQRLATPVENPASHRCGHEGRKSGVGHAGAECEGRDCRRHAPRAESHAGDPLGRAAQQPEREIRETRVRLFVRRHGYLTASSFSSRSSRSILSMMVLTSTSISDPGE